MHQCWLYATACNDWLMIDKQKHVYSHAGPLEGLLNCNKRRLCSVVVAIMSEQGWGGRTGTQQVRDKVGWAGTHEETRW